MDINGNIEYVNPSFSKDSGYLLEDARELNFKAIISENISEHFYAKHWDTILSGKEWQGCLQFKKKDGNIESAETIISPVKNKSGKKTHFIITKNAIVELGEQEQKINDLIRFGQLSNLSCSLMHELKSHFALIKDEF